MKVLITGANGQLGYELARSAPAGAELLLLDRDRLDITDADAVAALMQVQRPSLVINGAAYTAVDKAESDVDNARAINAAGAGHIAAAAKAVGAQLIHISTDFVFDGRKSSPYLPGDATAPLGVYGQTKLEGEWAVREQYGPEALILRTSWLYSAHGANFVKSILRLVRERPRLGIVADQVGTPTWAATLAEACWAGAARGVSGTHHWSDAGVASWYDFAVAIQEIGLELKLLDTPKPIAAIATSDYPTPAKRPPYSVMDKRHTWRELDLEGRHWRATLKQMMQELADA